MRAHTASRMMAKRASNVVAPIGAAVITYRCARMAAALFLRVGHPPRGEALLISDVILVTAFVDWRGEAQVSCTDNSPSVIRQDIIRNRLETFKKIRVS